MISQNSSLDIVVCGAGLGGLSAAISCTLAGHNVTVLEGAKELTEIGAGLQITPNGARLLRAWGLGEEIDRVSAIPTTCTVHRYTGKVLAFEERFDTKLRLKFGEPFLDIHRADLQQILYRRALDLGVDVLLGHRVMQVTQQSPPVVVVESGKKFTCDLVVGADGLWSKCREILLGGIDKPIPTGDLAYRIVLTADQIRDTELREWITKPQLNFWIGDKSHVVAYSLKAGTMCNIVLLCPDDLPEGVSRETSCVEDMKALFEGWDPILTKFLNHVEQVDRWRLMHHEALDSWSNSSKNLVLIGDSCHPMLPYLAQGANSSLEDGAALGRILTYIRNKRQLPQAIELYEQLRKERATSLATETFKQRDVFHIPDGPEQIERDMAFEVQLGKEIQSPFPSKWTDPDSQEWLFGYDAYLEADKAVNMINHAAEVSVH